MDDFVLSNLHESKNEWCSRLVSIFSPLIIEGIKSIFEESCKMCIEKDEMNKYLMTFQNLLGRVHKWNSIIIEEERNRIIERSGCNYLEDLITCVHIIQLKVLTCIRVGNKQKKIDISIPRLDMFIHKIYIHVARKIYSNVYLFDKQTLPLQIQKNGRELEMIVQECIMTTIRESIPTEEIIRAYMDESVEHEEEVTFEPILKVKEKENENENINININENGNEKEKGIEIITDTLPIISESSSSILTPPLIEPLVTAVGINNIDDNEVTTRLKFNDYDSVLDEMNTITSVNAPKTLERLEEISTSNALQRKLDEAQEEDEDKIRILEETVDLGLLDVVDMDVSQKNEVNITNLLDIEELK